MTEQVTVNDVIVAGQIGTYCVTATCCPSLFLAGLVGRFCCSDAYTRWTGYAQKYLNYLPQPKSLCLPQTIYHVPNPEAVDQLFKIEEEPVLEAEDALFGDLPFQIEDWASDRGSE